VEVLRRRAALKHRFGRTASFDAEGICASAALRKPANPSGIVSKRGTNVDSKCARLKLRGPKTCAPEKRNDYSFNQGTQYQDGEFKSIEKKRLTKQRVVDKPFLKQPIHQPDRQSPEQAFFPPCFSGYRRHENAEKPSVDNAQYDKAADEPSNQDLHSAAIGHFLFPLVAGNWPTNSKDVRKMFMSFRNSADVARFI
jgi:hypothetical protein